ncbi:MAG: carbohydrate ABC transporter permease, partial [Chloroflexi bacterium]
MATRALEIAGPRRSAWRQALENVPIHVFFIVAGVLWALPAIGLLVTSLRPVGLFTVTGWWTIFTGTGGQVGIDNYRHLFDSPLLAGSFVNSILIAVPATIIPVLFATLSAYAFTWLNFPGKTIFFLLLIALMVVPLQMALIPVAQLYGFIGPPGIVKVFLFHAAFALPYATFLFRNFFLGIPHELLESGRMDGANDWRIFRTIILPLAYPAIASFAVFQFLWVWNDLLVGLVFAGNT